MQASEQNQQQGGNNNNNNTGNRRRHRGGRNHNNNNNGNQNGNVLENSPPRPASQQQQPQKQQQPPQQPRPLQHRDQNTPSVATQNNNHNNNNVVAAAAAPAAASEYDAPPAGSKAQRGNNNRRRGGGGGGRGAQNTLTMEAVHEVPHARLVVDMHPRQLSIPLSTRDILLCPAIFNPSEKFYSRLVAEMQTLPIAKERVQKLWHGDSHFILDDHAKCPSSGQVWTKHAPVFTEVVDRLRTFFRMRVNATRFNWFPRDFDDALGNTTHKPKHHDAAAMKPDIAKIQNITVGVSFGFQRSAVFELADDAAPCLRDRRQLPGGCLLEVPLADSSVYVFTSKLNCEWRHGIMPLPAKQQRLPDVDTGRISIILWGYVEQSDLEY